MVGWLWYLITLLPVIGLVQVGNQAMADRYTYIPLIGIFIIIAWGIPELVEAASGKLKAAMAPAAVAVIGACMVLTWNQIGYWRDGMTLFKHAVAATWDTNRHGPAGGCLPCWNITLRTRATSSMRR